MPLTWNPFYVPDTSDLVTKTDINFTVGSMAKQVNSMENNAREMNNNSIRNITDMNNRISDIIRTFDEEQCARLPNSTVTAYANLRDGCVGIPGGDSFNKHETCTVHPINPGTKISCDGEVRIDSATATTYTCCVPSRDVWKPSQ